MKISDLHRETSNTEKLNFLGTVELYLEYGEVVNSEEEAEEEFVAKVLESTQKQKRFSNLKSI